MADVARFWFDRGVDGFRLDAVHTINADQAPYKDNLANPNFTPGDLPQQQQPSFGSSMIVLSSISPISS